MPSRQWQVSFLGLMDACGEAIERAKAERTKYYVLKFVPSATSREAPHYSAIDEEVFLMCGGTRGWGRPVCVYNEQGEPDGDTNTQAQG